MPEIIRLVSPVALQDVFDTLAPTFEAETGHRFEATVMLNPEVPDHVARGAPWSVAVSNPCYIQRIVETGACENGPLDLGYSPLALAVRGEAPGVRTGSLADAARVLGSARAIAVTHMGTSDAMFDRLVDGLDIGDEVWSRARPLPGGGPMAALLAGEVDVAVLPLTNVAPVFSVRAAVVCPYEENVHVDLSLCLHWEAGSGARLFVDRLMGRGMDERLQTLGLWRNRSIGAGGAGGSQARS